MRRLFLVLAMLFFATGCASSFDVKEHAADLCEIYETVRPDVAEGRDIIKSGFDRFTPEQQALLRRIDAELPKIDNAGQFVCEVARLGNTGSRVDWDAVASAVIDGVSLAVKLRAEGVI